MNRTPSNSGTSAARAQQAPPSAEEMGRQAEQAANFLKLMANAHRLMVLCRLLEGEMSVSRLNEHLPISQSALSQHLALLRNSGLVRTRREGQSIYYRIAEPGVESIIEALYQRFCATDKTR